MLSKMCMTRCCARMHLSMCRNHHPIRLPVFLSISTIKYIAWALFIWAEVISARKHFDEFTSEISPCYENNMKSYILFIWDKTFPV